VVSFA